MYGLVNIRQSLESIGIHDRHKHIVKKNNNKKRPHYVIQKISCGEVEKLSFSECIRAVTTRGFVRLG